MEIDKDILISKVFLKSIIWDKRLKGHANRKLVDRAWQEISAEMHVEDCVLRKKWKYLRDQFSIEVAKIPPSYSGDAAKDTESKWPYYKSLLFLKGIVKPRASSSNLKNNKAPAQVFHEDIAEIVRGDETEEKSPEGIQQEEIEAFDPQGSQETEPFTSPQAIVLPEDCQSKRKLNKANRKYNEAILSIESKKAKLLERVLSERGSEDDEDLLFFRSLLPHVKNIPQKMKLKFRNRVQQLVDEFAYADPNEQLSSTDFNSTSSSGVEFQRP